MKFSLTFFLLAVISLCAFTACDQNASEKQITQKNASADLDTWLPLTLGHQAIQVQIVVTPSEQQKGLMLRTELGENQGMLFPYAKPQRLTFWMKNTLIPLDIGYFDQEGTLLEVHKMYPKDTRAVPSTSQAVKFALEMNQGWFLKNKIFPGAQLEPSALASALQRRGF